jgi:hypothetical protein
VGSCPVFCILVERMILHKGFRVTHGLKEVCFRRFERWLYNLTLQIACLRQGLPGHWLLRLDARIQSNNCKCHCHPIHQSSMKPHSLPQKAKGGPPGQSPRAALIRNLQRSVFETDGHAICRWIGIEATGIAQGAEINAAHEIVTVGDVLPPHADVSLGAA